MADNTGGAVLVQLVSFSNRIMSVPLIMIRIWHWLVVVEVCNPMLYEIW
jgi:hypothetical protein